jgi:tetratricopeptide (TPR) repeat protein
MLRSIAPVHDDRQRPYRLAAVLCLSLAVGLATPALCGAQDARPSPADTALARSLFEQGMAAVDARDYATAADRLGRSLELRDSVVVRANLALALAELGRFVEAIEHLRQVQRATDPGSDAHALATTRLAQLLPRAGQLVIQVTGVTEGVEVRLDGRPVATAAIGVAQPADPGERLITAHRGARELDTAMVTVRAGETATASLEIPPPTAEEIAEAEAANTRIIERERIVVRETGGGIESEWWFWTLIGVALAGAVAGVVIWALLEDTSQDEIVPWGSSGAIFTTLVELP